MKTVIGLVTKVTRLGSTKNGNPRWAVELSTPTPPFNGRHTFNVKNDSGLSLVIDNSIYAKVPHVYTLEGGQLSSVSEYEAPSELGLQTIATLNVGGHQYTEVYFIAGRYGDGSLAIQCYEADDPTPITTVTVNLAAYGATPAEGCVFVKDYSENRGIVASLMNDHSLIAPTGEGVRLPHGIIVNEYRLLPPFRRLLGMPA